MKSFDVIVALGSGVGLDGSLSKSSQANAQKAVDLYFLHKAPKIIFSGKWSYKYDHNPIKTEASAMMDLAVSAGVLEADICLEEESITTVTNALNLKTKLLTPNNWKRVILVSTPHHLKRAEYNFQKVLGSEYVILPVASDRKYSSGELEELQKLEKQKMEICIDFFKGLKEGDHEQIFHQAEKQLKEYLAK
jgi:uncharacterized SAM-binding protein YcdF (DUF218 family)